MPALTELSLEWRFPWARPTPRLVLPQVCKVQFRQYHLSFKEFLSTPVTPLVLPQVHTLRLSGSSTHLTNIVAPQLQHLITGFSDDLPQPDTLRAACRGVLQVAAGLGFNLPDKVTAEEGESIMAVLNQEWKPSEAAMQAHAKRVAGMHQKQVGQRCRHKVGLGVIWLLDRSIVRACSQEYF
jgi:hypothetical protein